MYVRHVSAKEEISGIHIILYFNNKKFNNPILKMDKIFEQTLHKERHMDGQ